MAECINNKLLDNGGEVALPQSHISSLFNAYDLAKYNRVADVIIGELFKKYSSDKGLTVSDLKNPDVVQRIYNGIKGYMKNMLIAKASDNSSIWDRLSDKAMEDLDTIIENFDIFSKNHTSFNNIVNTKNLDFTDETSEETTNDGNGEGKEDEGVDDDEVVDNKGKEFDTIGNESSQIDLASGDIRILFRLLYKAEYDPIAKKSKMILDRDGLPTTANLSAVWNLLSDKLAGAKEYKDFVDRLTAEDTKFLVPEVNQINEILKIDKEDKSISEVNQFYKFYQAFSKPKVAIKSVYDGKDGNFSLNDEILGNKQKIEYISNNRFVEGNIPEEYRGFIKTTPSGVNYLQGEIPELGETVADRVKFLSFLGFEFSGQQFFSPADVDRFNSLINSTSLRIYQSLKDRLADGALIKEPIKQLKTRYSNLVPSERNAIDSLVNFESKWSRVVPTHSSRNVLGELQHLIMNDSALSLMTYYLNSSTTLEQLLTTPAFINAKYNPQFKNSFIVNSLFDKDGNKISGKTIELELLSGFNRKSKKGKDNVKLERNLQYRDKLIQDYNNFLNEGKTDTMRNETSHSFYMLGLYDQGKTIKYVKEKGFSTGWFETRDVKNQFLSYMKSEVGRIKSFEKTKRANPSLPDAYGDFSIFSEVFENGKNEELKKALLKEVVDSSTWDTFLNEYEKVLNNELSEFKNILNKNDLTSTTLFSKQLADSKIDVDGLHRAFILGTLMQNIEFSILYSGDTLFYNDMHKRLKGLSSTGNVAANLPLLEQWYNSSEGKVFHQNYSLGSAMNATRRDNTDNFNTQVLKEYPIRKNNGYLDVKLPKQIIDSVILRDGEAGKYTEDFLREMLKDAKDQKPADGQGYGNIDFARELALKSGYLTKEMDIVFKYEGLIFRRDILKQEITSNQEKELGYYENLIYSNPNIYSFPVVKMSYWGNVENTKIDSKAYDKFSVAFIMPSHARNHPEMAEILRDMVKGNYGYVKYKSGTKIYTKSIVDSLKGAKPDLYSSQMLKVQMKIDNEQKTETSIPTQLLKLAFANLFDAGKAAPAIQKSYEDYIGSLKNIQKEQALRLLQDLGFSFNYENGKPKISDINMTKLASKLVREAKRQQLNSNVIKSLEINPLTGKFTYSPEATGFHDQIGKLVSGIIDKTLRRFKFPGGDFVLITNANHSLLPWYTFTKDGTIACGCRITLTKEYSKLLNKVHPDGERIGTIERLNKLIASPTWRKENEKALTVILDRVPTDGPHSADFAIIHEFLPPTMGNSIILPDEITFKSGTDFDYDKEKTITPSLDSLGNYLTTYSKDHEDQILQKLNELQDIYPELKVLAEQEDDDEQDNYSSFINSVFNTSSRKEFFALNREANQLLQEYFNLKKDISSIKNNQIIETYINSLSRPEMFAELISPNATSHLTGLADKNGENTGQSIAFPQKGRTLYYTENLKVFKALFGAKNMLSMIARDNTFQALFNYSGIDINETYNIRRWDRASKSHVWVPEKMQNLLLSKEEYDKILKDGKILTSLREDIEGYIKQHINSEGINITVDSAKDPRFSLFRIGWENINSVLMLKTMGVPFERIVDFINHPALQEYFSHIQSGMSKQGALERMAKERFLFRTTKKVSKSITKEQYSEYGFLSDQELINKKLLSEGQSIDVLDNGRKNIVKKGTGLQVTTNETVYPDYFTILRIINSIYHGEPIAEEPYKYVNKWINDNPISSDRIKKLANPANDRTIQTTPARTQEQKASLYSDEIRLFSYFINMERLSSSFEDFKRYYNFDTTKTTSPIEVRVKDNLRNKIEKTNLYSAEDLQKMDSNSIIAPFINKELIRSTYSGLFSVLGDTKIQNYLAALYEAYNINFQIKNKRNQRNMPQVLSNDLISSIVFTYGKIGDRNLFDYGKDLLIQNGSKLTMVDRLVKFRKQAFYQEIARQFPILDRLISNKLIVSDPFDVNGMTGEFAISNIQLIKNANETLLDQEEVIEQFRDLYYNYKYELGNTTENEKINLALHNFMQDLFIAGITQSGVGKTFLGFSEYIPVEFKAPIFSDSLQHFSKLNEQQVGDYMKSFYDKFVRNNPKYFPSFKVVDENKKKSTVINGNRYSDRLKFYNIQGITPQISSKEENPDELRDDDNKQTLQIGNTDQNIELNCK